VRSARPERAAHHRRVTPSSIRGRLRHASARRRAGERGAALVEFAIVLVLVAMLLFGIIEFGIAYNDFIAVRQGTREGARLAVVDDVNNAPSCKIGGVTVSPPTKPTSVSDATNAVICKTKDRIGLDQTKTKVKILVAAKSVGAYVTVCASYPLTSVTGLIAPFVNGRTLTSSVVMRLEQPPAFDSYTESGASC
jgi:Flp pilus assembly protein TadG